MTRLILPLRRLSRYQWQCRRLFSSFAANRAFDKHNLFEYDSGRWLYNESLRLSERRRIFNVDELKRLAAQSVRRKPEDVVSIEKWLEGGSNRHFIISMRDGFQLVARIPYPYIQPHRLVVASEAATMRFLRSQDFPVPEVYGYSQSDRNAAGTEYIFMEYIGDECLYEGWDHATEDDRLRFIESLVRFETKLFELEFPAHGSIYCKVDLLGLEPSVDMPGTPFCIGTETESCMWSGRRSNLVVDRGPYTDTTTVLTAGAKKEQAYLQAYGRPLHPLTRMRRESVECRKQDPSDHIDTLSKYLKLAPYLAPEHTMVDDYFLSSRPTMNHYGLRLSDIYVTKNYTITSILDWQFTSILPYFLQCKIPSDIANTSDPISASFNYLDLTKAIEARFHVEPTDDNSTFIKRQTHQLYLRETLLQNQDHCLNLLDQFNKRARIGLYDRSCARWLGNHYTLKSSLVSLFQHWERYYKDKPCPISFEEGEAKEAIRIDDEQREAISTLDKVEDTLGIGSQGFVTNESFETVKEGLSVLKKEAIEGAEGEIERRRLREHWPFDDMDEDEYR